MGARSQNARCVLKALLFYVQKCLALVTMARTFKSIVNDPLIIEECSDFGFVVLGVKFCIKMIKSLAMGFSSFKMVNNSGLCTSPRALRTQLTNANHKWVHPILYSYLLPSVGQRFLISGCISTWLLSK